MSEVFDVIYKNRVWECQGILSGAGSHPYSARDYVNYLRNFKDRRVLDLGCGDLSIYAGDIFFKSYVGVDIVDIKKYKTIDNEVVIVNSDILNFDYKAHVFDLILIKDVFQHLCNERICNILNKLIELNVDIIITNDFNFDFVNLDCNDGDHHYLNMELNPFNLKLKDKYDWKSHFDGRLKQSILI